MGYGAGRAPLIVPLSAAEASVLRWLPTDLSFREIAESLCVSRHDVKTNAAALYRTLGVSSRQAALLRARELGLLASPVPNLISCGPTE
jgi:LuxR family maltose regulon positive regulatory protein